MQYKAFKLIVDGEELAKSEGYELHFKMAAEWSQKYPGGEIVSQNIPTPYEVQLTECYNSRVVEYPTAEQWIEARNDKERRNDLTKWIACCEQEDSVKLKYPKPDPITASDFTFWSTFKKWFTF